MNMSNALTSDAGMEWIPYVRNLTLDYVPVGNKKIVGGFGIHALDGRTTYVYGWTVNPRRDTRHGVVDTPVVQSKYYNSLLEGTFANW